MTPQSRFRWLHFFGAAAIALLVFASLSGAAAQPRTVLGWELEHFLGYLMVTVIICFAWTRPLAVATALVVLSFLLEALQTLTPDRTPNFYAAVWGAGGVLVGALLTEVVIRARRIKE